MSESFIVTGKTLEAAVAEAKKQYGDGITYDIIQMNKGGFLGIGAKEAKIKVTVEGHDDVLGSIVKEIKGYKSQTAPKTGYYEDDEKPAPEKKEKKEEKKPEQKRDDRHGKKNGGKPQNQPKPEKPAPAPKEEPAEAPTEEAAAPAEPDRKYAVSEDEMNFAIEFINTVIKNMKLSAEAKRAEPDGSVEVICTENADVYPAIEVIGDDTGILIGHHGETLDAIQYLVNLALFRRAAGDRGGRESIRITVDIENYRAKREETLRALARRMAARAVKYRRNIFLEPMNPYERRIIHSELQSYPDVSTHSVGSDINRKIVVTYEGTDKAPQRRRGGRGHGRGRGQRRDGEVSTPEAMPLPTLDEE